MKFCLLVIFFATQAAFAAAPKELTKDSLMKGSPIPEKRDYALSKTIAPCEDFHKYVCNEVESHFKLPADRERWNFSFTDIAERLLYGKKQFFKNIKNYTPKDERGQQFKDVYLACMNEKSSAAEEKTFVAEEKKKIDSLKTWQDLADLAQSRVDEGGTSFFELAIDANKEDPAVYDAFVIADARTLPERSYYDKKDLMVDFKKILVDFFKTIKSDKPEQRADWVISFESDLAHKAPLPKEIRDRYTEKRDIKREDFLKKYPNLKMERFIGKIPQKTVFIDLIPETNEFVNNALATLPLDQLKSVYMWHSIAPYLDDAYKPFFNKYFKFTAKYLGGPSQRPVRQERCTKLATGDFGMEVDHELMGILFPNFPEERMVKVGESVRQSIINGLKNAKWLSSSTRKEAIKKITDAKLYLVKPQTEADWDFKPVKKYDPAKPNANARLFAKTEVEKELKELGEKRSQSRWDMSPLIVNAYYSPPDNKFVLPQGILQFPFFDPASSDIENIAAIGAVVGHELGHGIDDQGAQYDSTGKVRKWFTDKDLKTFKEHGAKFIAQFDKIGHDGKLTLGENIGDHVGVTFAYNAAFPDPSKASAEDKKKFFISYARLWCNVATPSYKEKQVKTNPHSLGEERINQQVVHNDGFYEAFSCKDGDKMFVAPQDRIHVW